MTVWLADHAIERFAEALDQLGARNVFLVADAAAYQQSGAADAIRPQWRSVRHACFHDFRPNPHLSDVEQALRQFSQSDYDAIVALGGGTALDLGKLVSILSAQTAPALDVIRRATPMTCDGPPVVAIPTTAGTGSEATQFAVVYVDGEKYSLSHPWLLPEHAIIDPWLTASMPPRVTAASGLDCLCQAIESLWSVRATQASIGFAETALQLAHENLIEAVSRPTGIHRHQMCQAAHLAGQAINISRTTAAHALSYALTNDYDVPHGMAVALTIGPLLVYNDKVTTADCADARGPGYVRERIANIIRLLGCQSAEQASVRITCVLRRVEGPTRLREVGVSKDGVATLAQRANIDRLSNNPRRLAETDILELLQRCW